MAKHEPFEVELAPRLAWHFFILLVVVCILGGALGAYVGTTLALK